MTLFNLETLQSWTSEAAIEGAREAMDLESVSHFEFDRRGRLQAGVKPAPPCQQPSSYVKITVRGRRTVIDCRIHGKGEWCIHAVILALHHLGVLPIYQVGKPKPPAKKLKQIGFRFEFTYTAAGAEFCLRSLATGQRISRPLNYLQREPGVVKWGPGTSDILQEVAEENGPDFFIYRADLAVVLSAIEGCQLFDGNAEKDISWRTSNQSTTKLNLEIKGDKLFWRAGQPLPDDCLYVPGRPGFTIEQQTICRYPYVPDFQVFGSGEHGVLPIQASTMAVLLNEKHAVIWVGKTPTSLAYLPQAGIRLSIDEGALVGEAGFWHDDRFFRLEDWQTSIQWLPAGKSHLLLHSHAAAMRRFSKSMNRIRAPWQKGRFRIRQQAAPSFLEGLRAGPDIRIERDAVDRWFGMTLLTLETHWDEKGIQPYYRIDGERFEHKELLQSAYAEAGLRLNDGRVLNIDFGEIHTNARIISGVAIMHTDPVAQRALLGRIQGESEQRSPNAKMANAWLEQLRDYQKDGVDWLLNRFEQNEPALLADDMGLGKTIQTLALLDTIRSDKPQLIVVPRSLLANWEEESQRFCKHRRITIHHGPRRASRIEDLAHKDLVLTTYGTVLRDADLLYEVEFQMIVLDEAQAIKNPSAQTSLAVFDLWADHRLALTGTPIENRLTELWSIFNFLASGYLGDEDEIKALPGPGTPSFEAFRKKVKPFLLRRLKGEVVNELPPKQELVIRVPLAPGQRSAYAEVLAGARQEFQTSKPKTMSILTKLLRLRQICCHLGLVDETAIQAQSAKFQVLLQYLDDIIASGHAALVFSQFTQLLGLLKFELEERDWPYLYLDGKTKDRQGLVHQFQAGAAPVFLISLKAGGTGLNLTRAGYVFHLDPWWNPMVMTQATDRAHRIGQTQTVMSYKIIATDTVEEDILKLQASKKFLAEGLWQDPDALWQGLDQETLMGLLQ